MKKQIIILLLISIIILIILKINMTNKVCFREDCFYVKLAKTPLEKSKGLMFVEDMNKNKGMLFIYDNEDIYSFWMKNTLIPLDIIWINKDYEVVYISKNTQPCNKTCNQITPNQKAKYVLELNAGITDKINLSVGDKMEFRLN
jgi:uncharacterized membrane protein (UPF0127 family)